MQSFSRQREDVDERVWVLLSWPKIRDKEFMTTQSPRVCARQIKRESLISCVCVLYCLIMCICVCVSTDVSTVIVRSVFHRIFSATSVTSITKRNPSNATCVTAASGNKPTWTGTSKNTRMVIYQVYTHILIYILFIIFYSHLLATVNGYNFFYLRNVVFYA